MTKRSTNNSRRSEASSRTTRKPAARSQRSATHSRRTAPRRSGLRISHWRLTPAQKSWIIGSLLLGVALLTLLGFLPQNRGTVTTGWIDILRHIFGWGMYAMPLVLAFLGLWVLASTSQTPLTPSWPRLVGAVLLYVATLALVHHLTPDPRQALETGRGGGYIGYWLSVGLSGALSWAGATVVLILLEGMGLMLAFDLSLAEVVADAAQVLRHVVRYIGTILGALRTQPSHVAPRPQIGLPDLDPALPPGSRLASRVELPGRVLTPESPLRNPNRMPGSSLAGVAAEPIPDATIDAAIHRWTLPSVEMMLAESDEAQMSLSDIREKTHIIEETLTSLGVPVTVVEVNPGPVVTQFGLEPGYTERRDRQGRVKRAKVKVSHISSLANDLALALAAAPIRIEAPVPGKGIVGIEIPNREASIVGLRGVIESEQYRALGALPLALGLGRNVSGMAVVDDLATMPHLLIAGATGTGKSVCLNALIATMLCRNTPDDLRMLMIDPKRVELSGYDGIPHLIAPVVVEPDRVVGVLGWVTREMDRRYKVFQQAGARNIESYNHVAATRGDPHLPYIAVFIDELAELMMVAADEVERQVCRIAQLARATGIHLVIATQRPSVDVVTGLIKANFPARLAFLVSSQVDSRVILDTPGAEKLLGRGDALYMAPDSPKLLRIQGCFVSDDEINQIVAFWKNQAALSKAAMTSAAADGEHVAGATQQVLWPDMKEQTAQEDEDPLLAEATRIVCEEGRASVSFLQRKLRIGYTRAARLIDLLEEQGVIGEATGSSRPREVHLTADSEDAQNEDTATP